MKKTYNHTLIQKYICLPILWIQWIALTDKEKQDLTWHKVKKGIEKHEHAFTINHKEAGYQWLKCNHEGCHTMIPKDF